MLRFDLGKTYGVQVINVNPDIPGGTPVFDGKRVPNKNYLETGDSIDTFLEDFEGVHANK